MKHLRYCLAAALSLVVHGVALSFSPEQPKLSVANEQAGSHINIQFVARQKAVAGEKKVLQTIDKNPAQFTKTQFQSETKSAAKKPTPQPKPTMKPVAPSSQKATTVKKETQPIAQVTNTKNLVPVDETSKATEIRQPSELAKAPTQVTSETKKIIPETESNRTVNNLAMTEAAHAQHSQTQSSPKLIEKPSFSTKPTPVNYPRLAQKRGMQGSAMIEVWLDENGNQIKQILVNSTGHQLLDDSAIKAVSQWKFNRRLEQGSAIAYRVHIPVSFKLN